MGNSVFDKVCEGFGVIDLIIDVVEQRGCSGIDAAQSSDIICIPEIGICNDLWYLTSKRVSSTMSREEFRTLEVLLVSKLQAERVGLSDSFDKVEGALDIRILCETNASDTP